MGPRVAGPGHGPAAAHRALRQFRIVRVAAAGPRQRILQVGAPGRCRRRRTRETRPLQSHGLLARVPDGSGGMALHALLPSSSAALGRPCRRHRSVRRHGVVLDRRSCKAPPRYPLSQRAVPGVCLSSRHIATMHGVRGRRMSPWLRIFLTSLLAGLLLTVGVAWGCIGWSGSVLSGAMTAGSARSSGSKTLSGGSVTLFSGDTTILGGAPGWNWRLKTSARNGSSHTTHLTWNAGWPWRALDGEYFVTEPGPLVVGPGTLSSGLIPIGWRTGLPAGWSSGRGASTWGEPRLPLIPHGVGFGLDVLFWTGIVGAPPALWLGIRTRARRRAGRCRQCAYDLTGNTTGVCPECGNRGTS
jgi:hypothetical protein